MLPLEFPDKQAAILGAFLDRFAIGFVIGCVQLKWPGWVVGFDIRLAPEPSCGSHHEGLRPNSRRGALGGTIIGFVIGRWGAKPDQSARP